MVPCMNQYSGHAHLQQQNNTAQDGRWRYRRSVSNMNERENIHEMHVLNIVTSTTAGTATLHTHCYPTAATAEPSGRVMVGHHPHMRPAALQPDKLHAGIPATHQALMV